MIAAPSAESERYIRGPIAAVGQHHRYPAPMLTRTIFGRARRPLFGAIVTLALTTPSLGAQTQARAPAASVADSSPFRPLDLPTPNNYRTGSGRPGPGYWQQRVDYNIAATLDPARNELHGSETIHYANHAPEALPYLWLFIEQNICAPNSVTNQLNQPPLSFLGTSFDFSCQGFKGGLVLDSVRVAGVDVKPVIYGTTMRIDLASPLASGSAIDLRIAWHFSVPAQGAGRMGHDGPLYEIAQWYPRMAVYDDVRGWNHEPYIGAGEFYLEYGSFDVSLKIPATYIVTATGELQNPQQVLTGLPPRK